MLCRQMLEQIFVVAEKAELTIFQTFAKQHTSHLIHLIGHSDIAGPCAARGWGSSQSGADSNFKCQNFHLVTHLIVS